MKNLVKVRLVAGGLMLSLLGLGAGIPAMAAGTIDQSVTSNTGSNYYFDSRFTPGQTFTAGASGLLSTVTVDLAREGDPGVFIVEVFAVSGGLPDGPALASESMLQASVATVTQSVTVDFASPASMINGVQYAIVVRAPSAAGSNLYLWGVGGEALSGEGSVFYSGSWRTSTDDFRFATYVSAPTQTVTFDGNGGVGTMPALSSSAPMNLSPNAFTNPGFAFAGWNTEPSGLSGTPYDADSSYTFAADMTLFAQWSPLPASPTHASPPAVGSGETVALAKTGQSSELVILLAAASVLLGLTALSVRGFRRRATSHIG